MMSSMEQARSVSTMMSGKGTLKWRPPLAVKAGANGRVSLLFKCEPFGTRVVPSRVVSYRNVLRLTPNEHEGLERVQKGEAP